MDFAKFYSWRRAYSIVEMSKGPVKGDTCRSVFDALVLDGVASGGKEPGTFVLADFDTDVTAAKRLAARLMNELLKENDKLVRKLVNQIFKRSMAFTEEEDLYQSGLLAFVKTLERFDPARFSTKVLGGSFCTYLRHWIRDYTQRSTTAQQPIKHPRGYGMPYSVYRKAEDILAHTGRAATAAELGTYKHKGKILPVTDAKLLAWGASQSYVVSMDQASISNVVGASGIGLSSRGGEFVESGDMPDSSKNPESLYERAEIRHRADALIAALTDEEQKVLHAMREGDSTNRKIAQLLGCKEGCARMFKIKLIEKLQARAARAE